MFGFNKPKFDLQTLLTRIENNMGDELAAALSVQDPKIQCISHKQGVDVVFSFIKKDLSPVRKKISHLIRTEKALKQNENDVYLDIKRRLKELGEIRLNELSVM